MAVTLLYVTEEPAAGLAEVDTCTLQINIKDEVIPSIVCSVCVSFGLIYCFFGYRCLKMVLFFSGFMSGTAAILLLYNKEPVLDSHLSAETKAGIGLGVGVLCGLITLLVSTIGFVLSGLQLGSLLCLGVLVVVGQFCILTPVWVPLGAALAASIITAVLTLLWQKLFTILYTSGLGAMTVMLCVDYVVGTFVLPEQVYDMFHQGTPSRPLCWFDWTVAGMCPLLSLIGGLVQCKCTASGLSHTQASHKKQKKHGPKHRHSVQRGRPRSHRRRGPPPLKRYAGDVLAPSYIQSLQERQMGTGSSTSSVSTITHPVIDFDFETGSMVPLTAASPVFTV